MLKYAALAILTTFAAPAYALDCVGTPDAYSMLSDGGFQPVFAGDAENATLQIWVHPTQGWVSIIDTQDGKSCLVGSGMDWQSRGLGDPA